MKATYAMLIVNGSDTPADVHFRVPGETDQERLDYAEAALTKAYRSDPPGPNMPLLLFRKTSFQAMDTLVSEQKKNGLAATEAFLDERLLFEGGKTRQSPSQRTSGATSPPRLMHIQSAKTRPSRRSTKAAHPFEARSSPRL